MVFVVDLNVVLVELGVIIDIMVYVDIVDIVYLIILVKIDESCVLVGDEFYFEEFGRLVFVVCYYEEMLDWDLCFVGYFWVWFVFF